jgi:hypothetical protein
LKASAENISAQWNFTNANSITFAGGIDGGYSTYGGSSAFGAPIWSIDSGWNGSGTGSSYVVGNHYGISWLRAAHSQSDARVGEGLYGFVNGAQYFAFGTTGALIEGNIYFPDNASPSPGGGPAWLSGTGQLFAVRPPAYMQILSNSGSISLANTLVTLQLTTSGADAINRNSSQLATVSGGVITFAESGIYKITIQVQTVNSNRTELIIQMQEDLGSGFVNVPRGYASDYVSRDTDQNTGGCTLTIVRQYEATESIRFNLLGDSDGTCTLDSTCTHVILEQLG